MNGQSSRLNRLKKYSELDTSEIFRYLSISSEGLNSNQIESMKKKYGTNEYDNSKRKKGILNLLKLVFNPFSCVLLVLAVISFITDILLQVNSQRNYTTVIIIVSVIIVSSLIRLYQDKKAIKATESLQNYMKYEVKVKRNGTIISVSLKDITVGDIVYLSAGDYVPTDLRIIDENNLHISQSSITGESEICKKAKSPIHIENQNSINKYTNIAFMSTTIISGTGIGIVVAVGKGTFYIHTVGKKASIFDKQVKSIDREKALLDPQRITLVTKYNLEHFEQKTYRNQNRSYFDHKIITKVSDMAKYKNNTVEENRLTTKVDGFNFIFCVASIPAAMAYYNEFKKQMETKYPKLNIATIFSFNPNEEEVDCESVDDVLQDESFDVEDLDATFKEFLDKAILDYNKMFKVEYNTSAKKFQNHNKDVLLRIKNREIDLLIVVNMFLTGFDATTLNTLWVDKNIIQHGLISSIFKNKQNFKFSNNLW